MKIRLFGIRDLFAVVVVCCLFTVIEGIGQMEGGRPTVAVIDFETRPKVSHDAGRELSEMLVNSLLETGRFTVVDRSRTAQIQHEQREALLGTVDPATGASVGKMLGAQYLIIGSVTQFEERKASGLGMLGGIVNMPGSGSVTAYRALVKFNLQVIHSTTGSIVFSKSFEKDVKSNGLSGGGAVVDVPDFKSKAMQQAVDQSMKEAVSALVEKIGTASPVQAAQTIAVPPSVLDCSRLTRSRIMVIIPEIHIRQRIPDPAGETEIIKKLVGQGFNVVDQKQVAAIRDREKVLTAIKNPQAAASLGAEFGANIIIIGEAFSELASRERGMVSTRARVEARAIQTDTARILAADGKFGSGLDIAEFVSAKTALRNAGGQWADYFISQVCQAAGTDNLVGAGTGTPAGNMQTLPVGSGVEVLVSNVTYAQLKQFTDRLEKLPGVRSVEKKLTGNVARVDVQYDGTAEKLADAISETKFGLLRVNIVGLSGSKIEIGIGR